MDEVTKLVTTVRALRATSGSAKEYLLKLNDTPLLRKVLVYAYNPYYVFGIKQYGEHVDVIREKNVKYCDLGEAVEAFFAVLDALRTRQLTGSLARTRLDQALNIVGTLDREVRSVMEAVVDKDLDVGCGVATINKAFPGLIPKFSAPKGHVWTEKLHPSRAQAELKYDGKRIVAVIEDGIATLFSYEGRVELKYQHIRRELEEWAKREGITHGAADSELNWGMYGDRSKLEADAELFVFDFYTWDEWAAALPKKKPRGRKQLERTAYVQEKFGDGQFPHLRASRVWLGVTADEACQLMAEHYKKGVYDGIMVKDMDARVVLDRSNAWLKLKPVKDADLRVVDVFEGDGKYAGMLGGFIVDYKGKEVRVGAGFSDEQRELFWGSGYTNAYMNAMGKDREGIVVEVRYTEVTPDGSLRHPRFVRVRDDK